MTSQTSSSCESLEDDADFVSNMFPEVARDKGNFFIKNQKIAKNQSFEFYRSFSYSSFLT